jgi:TetR/AcrR family transcriptional repressor of nem operon
MGRHSNARQRLIQSAKQLTYAHGYNAVGVKEICDHAGVNKGSFYHFFPSKRDLLLAVIDAHTDWFRGVLERASDPQVTALERIRRVFLLVGEFDERIQDDSGHTIGCPFGNLAAELNAQDPVIREKLAGVFAAGVAFIEGQLREAVELGELEVADPHHAAHAIFAYLEGLQLLASTQNSPRLVRLLADGAIRLAALGAADIESANGPSAALDLKGESADLETRGLAT